MHWVWLVGGLLLGCGSTLAAVGLGIWLGRHYGWLVDDLTDHR